MYTSFFGLNEKPFAITPDPRYLYLSERHTEALAHLAYGISEAGGFIQLTGEVGTGKTTVLRSLLQQLPPHCDVARSSAKTKASGLGSCPRRLVRHGHGSGSGARRRALVQASVRRAHS